MSERRVDVSTAPMGVAARETNKVLRNTYMLLGMTLAFSAVTATISMVLQLPTFMYLVFVLVGFGLLFVVNRMADSAKGLPAIFAFTGVMGAALVRCYVYLALPNGPNLVLQSLVERPSYSLDVGFACSQSATSPLWVGSCLPDCWSPSWP